MKIDAVLENQVNRLFAPLRNSPATALPPIGALSSQLTQLAPPRPPAAISKYVPQEVAKLFSTAAVNTWMRAVHSFLISSSLTNLSPIWASVAGYYSSHYSVRAVAHVLGYFQLFTVKQSVQLEFDKGRFIGTFKAGREREHYTYWKFVKGDPHFAADGFFTDNSVYTDDSGLSHSDVAHRDRANYADHLPHFPIFKPLSEAELRDRIEKISSIEVATPPIPVASRYPDLESVQVIAYHRLVRFRDLLDTILRTENRFWNVHRSPPWARDFIDFQVTDADSRRSQFTIH